MSYVPEFKILEGDIFDYVKTGEYDVIAHGCNCFNNQKSGLAPQMVKYFYTNDFPMEQVGEGDINKLGQIDWVKDHEYNINVVNCYTQYYYGKKYGKPIDYEALTLCMRKMNKEFYYHNFLLPFIGCGLAGGDETRIVNIIKKELKDAESITMIRYKK